MKYVRTEDGRIVDVSNWNDIHSLQTITMLKSGEIPNKDIIAVFQESEIIKQADTIEELCDELVVVQKDFHDLLNADTHCLQTLKRYYEINKIEVLGIYGAIWTDKGLIYVAKMNEKGELELI